MRKNGLIALVLFLVLLLAAGCAQGDSKGTSANSEALKGNAQTDSHAEKPKKTNFDPANPVTLNILWSGPESQFNERVLSDAVKKRMPNATFKMYALKDGVEKMIASGVKLDVMNVTTQNLEEMKELGLTRDMSGLMKAINFDMSRFKKDQIEIMNKIGGGKQIISVPGKSYWPYTNYALAYNKDIFDKFGVPYPKDHMTWDEVLELAKRVTRTDGGVEYVGLGVGAPGKIREQNLLSFIGKDGKVNLSDPLYSKIFDVWKRTFDINHGKNGTNVFVKDKTMAMFAGNIRTTLMENATRQKEDLPSWDMVTYPTFKGEPFVAPTTRGVYAVASTSENPDAAMVLVDALLSKEVADTIMNEFMNPELEKKNIKAIEMPENTFLPDKYDSIGAGLLGKKLNEMNKDNLDVNTALRQLQDEMQKAYDEAKTTGQ